MNKRVKKWSSIGTAAAALAGAVVLGTAASPANADTRCNYGSVWINSGGGAEAPSWANGHSHNTGNHFVGAIWSNGLWDWYADNNGGNDGDTWDTYYGSRWC